MSRGDLPPIRFEVLSEALLSRAEHIVPTWLPGGRLNGHEWVCAGLHGGEGHSCSVNLRNGRWADFASDEKGGDLVSLYAAIHGLDQGRAAVAVARDEGLEDVAGVQRDAGHQRPERPAPPPAPAKPPREDEGWTTVRPVPDSAPAPTFRHYSRQPSDLVRRAEYRVDDQLHGYVVRFRTSTGGKDDLPYTWATSARDGAAKWCWRQFDEPRPLYLPGHQLPAGRVVVLVEGERKAELLQQLLDQGAPGVYCVASWPGGCKAWAKADWSWIAGSDVLAWPDTDSKRAPLGVKAARACADDAERDALKAKQPYLPAHQQPGMAAMLGLGRLLEREHGCRVQLLAIDPPGVRPDGWDAADAIEADGWDFDQVRRFFGTAYALPAEGAAPDAPKPAPAPKNDGPVATAGSDSADGLKPWWLAGFHDPVKGRWAVSRKTVIAALRHDPALQGVLGFNELTNALEARRAWPFPGGKAGPITGAVDLLLGDWLSGEYGMPSISRQSIAEAMETVAHENRWHPVREWLAGLKWDGRSRIDQWLLHAIREDEQTLDASTHEYLTLVSRFWLIGLVKRVMEPGSKFDYCPVLEGPGGLRKSTLVETLVGSQWYSDTRFDIEKGKEGQEQVQGVWGYELGELDQMSKAGINAVKAFISSKIDRYRPAYGRVVESHQRQVVLMGTTNESTYLRDRTGNRRFWPIPVRNVIRIDWLAERRAQLFAEAYALYLEGATCIPTPDQESRLFKPIQESRLIETAITSTLLEVLTREPKQAGSASTVNELTDFVTIADLVRALDMDPGKSTAGLESQIRGWMVHQGWIHTKKQVNGARATGWKRPLGWPNADTQPAADAGASRAAESDDAPF